MRHIKSYRPFLSICAIATSLASPASLLSAPAWYANGVGGFIANTNDPTKAAASPTVPDFYQHQNWIPASSVNGSGQTVYNTNSSNGWESSTLAPNGSWQGWCAYTAYADVIYDLQSQGYAFNILADPTNAANWYTATYGPAGKPLTSNIAKIATIFGAGFPKTTSMQTFLNANVNNQKQTDANGDALARLTSQTFLVNSATGLLQYWSYSKGTMVDGQKSSDTAYDFTNNMLKRGEDVMYLLTYGTNTVVNDPTTVNFWWANHAVAVSGVSVANKSVYIADPDTNGGPAAANAGWIRNSPNFPGALASAANATLPVPALNSFDNNDPTKFNSNYDRFTFANQNYAAMNAPPLIAPTVTSPDAPQFNNTFLSSVLVTGPSIVNKIKVAPRASASFARSAIRPATVGSDEETDLTLQIPETCSPIDEILVEPSTQTVNPSTDPTAFSLTDDTRTGSTWSDAEDTTDPFGNSMTLGSVEYDLAGGTALEPGDTVDVDLETTSDFSSLGYDVLIHFQGDPSGEWTPEMIAGSEYDPSDYPADDDAPMPEPSVLGVLGLGGIAMTRRRQRVGGVSASGSPSK
jgi:hypothetical protein